MKLRSSEKGQALILITFAMIALIGFTALAIDGGRAFEEKRHAQNAADTSALAAALAYQRGENILTTAQQRAASNGYDDNGTTGSMIGRKSSRRSSALAENIRSLPSSTCPVGSQTVSLRNSCRDQVIIGRHPATGTDVSYSKCTISPGAP